MAFKSAILILALAALSPFLYDNYLRLSAILNNAPDKLVKLNNLKSFEIKFEDSVRSCEDALLIESKGLALLSCDPGRESYNTVMGIFLPGPVPSAGIFGYFYNDASAPDSESFRRFEIQGYEPGADFHTLGMAYDEASSTLFVANHRKDGPTIEAFQLDLTAFTAKHFRTIRHSLLHAPNAIALLNGHELLVTNDHYFLSENHHTLSTLETYLGLPLGTVVHVDISSLLEDPAGTVKTNVLARVPFANGITLLNETTVAVASTTKPGVYFYTITKPESDSTAPPTLTSKSLVKLPYFVDNIRVSRDGALYAAGHPHPPSLNKFSATRHKCNSPDIATTDPAVQEECRNLIAPSWVTKWTEEKGVENLYVGTDFPTSCTAAFDSERKVGVVAGLYGKGIMVWRE
ncbi:putative paraoxonase [Hypoxylon sp. EC38]|nr:putative paraoxonase [Hypoxylon sp. EC38]